MAQKSWKIEEIFPRFVNAQMAKGVSDKTVLTYNRHFHSLGYHLDMTMTFDELTKEALDSMLVSLRKSGVSPNTISSYARVFRTFLKWCRAEGYTDLSLPNIQDKETVKGSYTDEELIALLRKPAKDCDFCEYRNWVIVNFLINSGCRAGTIRNIQNRDVSLSDKRVIYRHTKTGKLQSVPLCSQMAKILSEYMGIRGGAPEDYLFCTVYGEMMSENALSCAIKKYNHKRGVVSHVLVIQTLQLDFSLGGCLDLNFKTRELIHVLTQFFKLFRADLTGSLCFGLGHLNLTGKNVGVHSYILQNIIFIVVSGFCVPLFFMSKLYHRSFGTSRISGTCFGYAAKLSNSGNLVINHFLISP